MTVTLFRLFSTHFWICAFVGLLFLPDNALALDEHTILVEESPSMEVITEKVYFLEDTSGEMTLSDILALEEDSTFQLIGQEAFNTPATNATLWFRFTIQHTASSDIWLELGDAFSAWFLDFYSPDQDGNYNGVTYSLGSMRPKSNKKFPSSNYCVPLVNSEKAQTYYMKVQGGFPMLFVFHAGNTQALVKHTKIYDNALSVFLGAILALAIYNLFLWISTRDKLYLKYIAYLGLMVIAVPFDNGNPLSFNHFWWNYAVTWHGVLYLLITLFAVEYLELKKTTPRLFLWVWFLTLILVVLLPFVEIFSLMDKILLNYIFQSVVLVFFLSWLVVGVYSWAKGQTNARFYVLAWVALIASVFIFVLAINGFLPLNVFTKNVGYIGISAEALLFSLALGDRFNSLKKVNEQVQAENLKLVSEQNTTLERKVIERTREIQIANDELQANQEELQAQQEELQAQQEELSSQNEELLSTLEQLKIAQSQLVQSEKMASLGLLTAGLAHEINNPINFIKSGITGLQGLIEQFSYFSELYKDIKPENVKESLDKIASLKEELKFDEMMGKAMRITRHIDTGANRTAEIVKGLRSYSRSNSIEYAPYNVIDGINDNLLLLNHLLGAHIEIFRNFDEVPEIECSAGQINQVLMNLMVNAIQSIKEEGSLFISTNKQGANVVIKIKDTGVGIPAENLKHIFDPFFTTKDVGEGTGLGLSIVKGIVEEHGGSIEVESVVGEGTTFEVSLPISRM
ncbi:7TM diverse intracellular signaling domain-containing protein [Flammeovirgaceae bacterium SG7u.111]|nr:7TM diverse intracellular signaling domain-containing protein [Flammeovirgaceae bacterium SG7u.132]WPO36843.1 7TM diverse intracellular signaling domain-containing protein [Flammeovirgaceae bacterium SG7u.111]